jgi:acetyl esterase/lipase
MSLKAKTIVLNEERNVTLTCYLQDVEGEYANVKKRPAMLILPGGGYSMCSDREADPVALAYLRAGYHAFVLRYSVKEHATWPNPLNDYEQAMELIKRKAEEWKIWDDKIAVIGFSAGGHLAACAATMAKNRPNAALLGYPAILENIVHACLKSAPLPIEHVDGKTSPCFVFTTRTDTLVPVQNSIEFTLALAKHNISFESHIYAYGPHGFSTCDPSVNQPGTKLCSRVENWVEDSIQWLQDMFGTFGAGVMTEPRCGRKTNGDDEEYLSSDCTVGHLLTQEAALPIIDPVIQGLKALLSQSSEEASDDTSGVIGMLFKNLTLNDVMAFANLSHEQVSLIDEALRKVPNKK